VRERRRLAAIMFTDMVGYTALGQRNESLSITLVNEQRKLLRLVFKRHNGREIKTIGDAFLVEFPSALEAIRCAYEMAQSLHERNASHIPEKQIPIRIGIHLGDIIRDENDVYGDAVNVASRIEPLAEAGGICVSQQVYDQIRNKFEFPLSSLGKKELKNVELPIEVFKVVLPWTTATAREGNLDKRRIAVLPFANISSDSDNEYFADGMTEELISAVSKVPELSVISRTSVMQYKTTKSKDVSEISSKLNVGTILEGSVRRAGNRVRIAVQLIDANNDKHLWVENYDRNLEDVFAIQSEIAQNVAAVLKIRLLDETKDRIRQAPTLDAQAHDYYLKGLSHINFANEEEYMTALAYFERAIERDPRYALAYAQIARVYGLLGFFEMMHSKEAFSKAEKMARRAIELDDSLAEAHEEMAFVLGNAWDFVGSAREIQRALELSPNLALAHITLAFRYQQSWQADKGILEGQKALELDPQSTLIMQFVATLYLYDGQLEKAIELFKRVLELDPTYSFSRGNLGLCYVKKGLYDIGVQEIKKGIEASKGFHPSRKSDLVYALSKAGRIDEANGVVSDLLRYYEERHLGAAAIACAYGALGDKDKALEWLEEAYREHSAYLGSVSVDFGFEDMHSDPRFLAFLKKVGLFSGSAH
jgi:adenylate cyclase